MVHTGIFLSQQVFQRNLCAAEMCLLMLLDICGYFLHWICSFQTVSAACVPNSACIYLHFYILRFSVAAALKTFMYADVHKKLKGEEMCGE